MTDPPLPHLTGEAKDQATKTATVTREVTIKVVIARPLVLFLAGLTLLVFMFLHWKFVFTPILYLPGQGDIFVRSLIAIGVILLLWSLFDFVRWFNRQKENVG